MGKNRKTQRKNGVEQGIPGRIGNVCTTKAGGIEEAVREEVKGTKKRRPVPPNFRHIYV